MYASDNESLDQTVVYTNGGGREGEGEEKGRVYIKHQTNIYDDTYQ
jgi:hypothetical protein